jgi:hypothetical protein
VNSISTDPRLPLGLAVRDDAFAGMRFETVSVMSGRGDSRSHPRNESRPTGAALAAAEEEEETAAAHQHSGGFESHFPSVSSRTFVRDWRSHNGMRNV